MKKQDIYTKPLSKIRKAIENLGASYLRKLIASEKLKKVSVFKDVKATKNEIEKYLKKKVKKGFQFDYIITGYKGNKQLIYIVDVKSTLRHPHIEFSPDELRQKLEIAQKLNLLKLPKKLDKRNIRFVVVFLHYHKHLSEKNAKRKAKLNKVKLVLMDENTGEAKIIN